MHWTLTDVLSLDHAERRRWMQVVADQLDQAGVKGDHRTP
jgi:hypothetical protein